MSQFDLNPMFLRMKKSLGDIVIYERNGQLFTRVKGKKTSAPTDAQKDVHAAFARLSSDWSSAGSLMNSSWYSHGERKKINGYNLYMKSNFKNEREGKAVELFKPMGEIMPPVINAVPGSAGQIVINYTIPEAGRFIHFFVKKRGEQESMLKRYSPEGEGQSFTVSNLEPAAEYFIYAALTDRTYSEATQVSASVAAVSVAG